MLDAYKELTPVVYGENAIKCLHSRGKIMPGKMCFSMHWHDRMEILRVCTGTLELHTEEGHFSVPEGQIAVISPARLHAGFAGSEGVEYHAIMFDVEKFCNATVASEKYLVPVCEKKMSFQEKVEDALLLQTVDKLVEILTDGKGTNPLQAVGTIYEILGILYRYRKESTRIILSRDKGFGAIMEYVNEHYTEKISPKDVSTMFGYNETYFCRRFREVTGITFTKYIHALRMEHAQKLLKSSRDEISIVAWKCGYSDVSYFSNCFKRFSGYTPTQFREM